MDLKKLKIIPPEGMEWYQEGNGIKFRPIKEKTIQNKNYNIEEYKEYLPYCCNLDDHEYSLLWEFYEESSIFDRLKNFIKGIFMFK